MGINKITNRYIGLPLPVRAAIWFTFCNFILKAISFITVPLFTRLIPPNEYGILSVWSSYEHIIIILATWEIQLGAYTRGLYKFKENVERFTVSMHLITNLITVCFFAIVLLFRNVVISFTEMPLPVIGLLFLYMLFRPAYNGWLTRNRVKFNYKPAVTMTILYSLLNVIVPLLAVYFIERTAYVKFSFNFISASIFCLFFWLSYLPKYRNAFKNYHQIKQMIIFMIKFEGPLVIHSLSYLVLSQADRIMIQKMVGSEEAAFYSVAYNLAVVVMLLQTSVNEALVPWRFQMLEEKQYSRIKYVSNQLLIVFGAAIMLYVLIAPEVLKLLFTTDYYEAVWCIPPIAISIFFMFLYSMFVNVEEYFEKTNYVTIVSVICGVVNVVLNYICIPVFGYIACGYTTLASYMLFALGHYYYMRKACKANDLLEDVADGKFVLVLSVIVVLFGIVVTLIYDYLAIRLTLGLLMVGFVVWKRDSIINLFKGLKKKNVISEVKE